MEEDLNFPVGFSWAVTLSIPLWISILGWIKLLSQLL
jgi:hypothetical protein